jgi:hypothetical protein
VATSVDSKGDVITDDFPCAKCGYNLRTLAVAGRCPECGEPVARSFSPVGFRFRNPMTPRRVRNGIMLFITGVLADVIVMLMLTVTIRLAYVIPDSLYSFTTRSLSYALSIARLPVALGLILMTWPFGRRGDRFAWPLGVAVSLAIAASAAPEVARFVHRGLTGGGVFSMGTPGLILGSAAYCASFLAPALAWLHLLARVRYARSRALWLAMAGVVLVHLLLFASSISAFVTTLQATKYLSVSGGTLTYLGPALKSATLESLLALSGHRISAFASLVTVAALWLYLHRLQRTTERAPAVREQQSFQSPRQRTQIE